jgi:hypothetical protein
LPFNLVGDVHDSILTLVGLVSDGSALTGPRNETGLEGC